MKPIKAINLFCSLKMILLIIAAATFHMTGKHDIKLPQLLAYLGLFELLAATLFLALFEHKE